METQPQVMTRTPAAPLSLEVATVKNELVAISQQDAAMIAKDAALNRQATDLVEKLFAIDPNDRRTVDQAKAAVEDMGVKLQIEAARKSAMLQQPINALAKRGADGGPVANALIDLKVNIEALDPAKFDFSPGWGTRLLGYIPGVGTPLKRYFTKYESAQTVLDAIMFSLRDGRELLRRDNISMANDQAGMREMTLKLEKAVHLAQLIDQNLTAKLEAQVPSDDPKYRFIQEELLFPLRQRIQDLQQQQVVNQQGVLALEIVIRNNKELVRGVDRCLNVTINALQVAVVVALALANQKIVLNKIQMVNETTDNLILSTSQMLREQGAAIHKQAASTMLSMQNLKESFAHIQAAYDDIATFRQQALPAMAQQILELNGLTAAQEKAIVKMEEGNARAGDFAIEIQ